MPVTDHDPLAQVVITTSGGTIDAGARSQPENTIITPRIYCGEQNHQAS